MNLPAIRPASLADIPQMAVLLSASWHRTYDALMGEARVTKATARIHGETALIEAINDPKVIALIAEKGGVILGVAKAERRKAGELHIRSLHIVPKAQGTGLADRLMHAACNAMPEATRLTLDVLEGNDRAIAYYAKTGFSVLGRLNACGAELGVPTIVMEKRLEE
jgi:ribosomal protein S18 acetylase RimI-like enzyme